VRKAERLFLGGLPYIAPAPGAVVSGNRSDEINECLLVDALVLVKLDASRRGIVLTLIYKSIWVRHDRVVNKNIHVIFSGEQCANIAVERKVWTVGKFDGFYNLWLCLVNELANLIANSLLPIRKRVYIFIDTGVSVHCGIFHLNRDYSKMGVYTLPRSTFAEPDKMERNGSGEPQFSSEIV